MPLNGNWCGTTLQGVTNMSSMFAGNPFFNQDINCWDVSTVQTFASMFLSATAFNNGGAAMGGWNTGAATNMSGMFESSGFNQDISAWNVSAVQNFSRMFIKATSYTNAGVSLSNWNPVAATDLSYMFPQSKYNMPLAGNWCGTTLQGVTTMQAMFGTGNGNTANTVFNQDISCWDVSTVQDFGNMFYGTTAYTNAGVSLSAWNPAAAVNMGFMFAACSYNMPLTGNWCGTTLQGVTNMRGMFQQAGAFNQDISCWDVSTVQNFQFDVL